MVVKNSLAVTDPALAAEFDSVRNAPLSSAGLVAGSHRKVWWVCSEGHSWLTTPLSRSKGVGCPYCEGRLSVVGVNDVGTVYPHLAAEWNAERNAGLVLSDFLAGSGRKLWWRCVLGHEWEAVLSSRTLNKRGCPVCSGNRVLAGFNDLASTHPELAVEWHPTRNGILTAGQVNAGSNRKVWWLCSVGHEWEAVVNNRKNGAGCFECSYSGSKRILQHKTPTVGVNDFASVHPALAAQWHPVRNGSSTPDMFKKSADFRAWWLCSVGHEWDAKISDRAHYQTGCPVCALTIYVSKAEQEVVDFITSLGVTVVQSDRSVLNGAEVDLWIPEKNVGIEFNGVYWHNDSRKTVKYHFNKWSVAKRKNVQLLQVWEDDWLLRKDVVKSMLAHKLGASSAGRVFARNTSVAVLGKQEAEVFLEAHHIQGFASGFLYVGLKDASGVLIAVMVLKREPGSDGRVLNIVRFATAVNVVGGFTKILSHVERSTDVVSFVTFSDHMVSDGRLYESNGFTADKELPPDYMYVVKGVRQHKFGYRLERFRKDPDLVWVEGVTERELADLNGLKRVWDAGKTRWVKHVESTDKIEEIDKVEGK